MKTLGTISITLKIIPIFNIFFCYYFLPHFNKWTSQARFLNVQNELKQRKKEKPNLHGFSKNCPDLKLQLSFNFCSANWPLFVDCQDFLRMLTITFGIHKGNYELLLTWIFAGLHLKWTYVRKDTVGKFRNDSQTFIQT